MPLTIPPDTAVQVSETITVSASFTIPGRFRQEHPDDDLEELTRRYIDDAQAWVKWSDGWEPVASDGLSVTAMSDV